MTNSSSHEPVKYNRTRLLEALLDSATDYAIIAMDLDGLVTSWNEGANRILGWTEEEMIGQPASVFFTLEDRQKGTQHAEMQSAPGPRARQRRTVASEKGWHPLLGKRRNDAAEK